MKPVPSEWIKAIVTMAIACGLCSCKPSESRVDIATREKILLIGNGAEPRSLDPHIASGMPEHHLISSILEGLTVDHPTLDDVVPGCAERWESNAGLDEWTFHLRPTARWSNGDPLVASDFVFSYQRMLSAEIGSEYSEMLYPLKGAREYHGRKDLDFTHVGVTTLGEKTLKLSLIGPTPHFPKLLQHYAWFPVHPATILKHGTMTQRFNPWVRPQNWVGNGPFTLKEWRFKHYIDVERNPHYWDKTTVKLNGIRFFPIDNLSTEERMWRDGQLHINEKLPVDKVKWWRDNRPDVYRQELELSVYFYRINTTRPPFNDVRVRRALSLAIDRKTLCESILPAGEPPAFNLVPPHLDYRGPQLLTYDPTLARSLLAEAGFAQGVGFPVRSLLYNTMDQHKVIAETLQGMWQNQLGLKFDLNNQDWQVYIKSMHGMQYDLCRAGWTGDYVDPMTFLDMWTTGNGQNETGWSNAEYDQLVFQAQKEIDAAKRLQLLKQAETIFLNEIPAIPLYFRVNTFLVHPSVQGWHPKLLNNHAYKFIDLVIPASK